MHPLTALLDIPAHVCWYKKQNKKHLYKKKTQNICDIYKKTIFTIIIKMTKLKAFPVCRKSKSGLSRFKDFFFFFFN